MRHHIKVAGLSKVMLLPFGATHENSVIEIEGERMHVHFGMLFDRDMNLHELKEAGPHNWSAELGIGVHTNLGGWVAIIGSTTSVIRLAFSAPQPLATVYGKSCTELFLSVEDPEAFLAELAAFIKP